MLAYLVVNFCLASSEFEIPCDYWKCPENLINNTYCNKFCMNPACNYDSAFYSEDKYLVFEQSDCFSKCDCDKEKLTNGVCDHECDNYKCGFDLGDCGYCQSGCFIEDLKSATCKIQCSQDLCYDYYINSCKHYCSPGCLLFDLFSDLDDYYSEECCTESCRSVNPYDTIDKCSNHYCAPKCTYSSIGDGKCQGKCYNAECDYDGGDCDCNAGCITTSTECTTNSTYKDPCDTESCKYKDGKCGYCASQCFKHNLGDGICQSQCNTESCNFDHGDCGCASNCSYKYDNSTLSYVQTGNSDECSVDCLVLDCGFGIDFCTDEALVKSAVLNFLVYKDREKTLDMSKCAENYCSSEDIKIFLEETDYCIEDHVCSSKECFYCMGRADQVFGNCLRQSFDECLLCDTTMVEGVCYKDIDECPTGYENMKKMTGMFENSLWCLKEAVSYSTSNYKEIFVNSSIEANGKGSESSIVKTLYNALVNVFADYTKIYLLNKEIDFFIDDSSSVLVNDKYDPLNIDTKYQTKELWIIGSYSETIKTIVSFKNNLKISPLAKKFYLKNIEFIGKYVMNNDCDRETCYYCPYVTYDNEMYIDDAYNSLKESEYSQYYSKECGIYSSVNIFTFTKEVYVENVKFAEFRYQYNSFIYSNGTLSLNNVNFTKMQAQSDGSIILLHCTNDCLNSSFTYNQGLVIDINAGYNDVPGVKVGSFFKSLSTGYISITNVNFSFNFVINNIKASDKSYLIYSKNHMGTISIENCEFYANYVNYLVYVDVTSLQYDDYRVDKGISLAHSQQHFFMNNITILSTYCSHGMVHYFMETLVHGIKITNLSVKKSVLGKNSIFKFVYSGNLGFEDINGGFKIIGNVFGYYGTYIYIEPKYLILRNITIQTAIFGKNAILIETFTNIDLDNICISDIYDYTITTGPPTEIIEIINLFGANDVSRHFSRVEFDYYNHELYINEMVRILNSMNLKIDTLIISDINTFSSTSIPLGVSIQGSFLKVEINKLYISGIKEYPMKFLALTIIDSLFVHLTDLRFYNIEIINDPIIKIQKCFEIEIESIQIQNVTCNFLSPFVVSDFESLNLSNFSFQNMKTSLGNGGCLYLLGGGQNSTIKINSGKFNECYSSDTKGGAIFLETLSKSYWISLQMYDVQISKCNSDEGSAIYIANSVNFVNNEESELVRVVISDNYCKNGGTISDYHNLGKFKIDGLEMFNNNQGIYVSYSNKNVELHVINSKIDAPVSLSPAFYFFNSVLESSIYFKNVSIMNSDKVAIEAYNINFFIDQVNISNTSQAFSLHGNLECEVTNLKITNSRLEAIKLESNCSFFCNNCEFTDNKDSIIAAGPSSHFSLVNSKIFANHLNSGYLILIASKDPLENSLINCQIFSNSLLLGSFVYMTSSLLTINNCSIVRNQGNSIFIHGIYVYNSILKIYESRLGFNGLVESGSILYAIAGSSVTVENSIFENSESQIGNIYGNNVDISINNCSFSGNSGGDIYTIQSNLLIMNSKFEKSLIYRTSSGVVEMKNNNMSIIEGTVFENISSVKSVSSAYIYDEYSKQLKIYKSTFRGSSDFIMGIYIKETNSVIIDESNFVGFSTEDYSALTLFSSEKNNNITVTSSKIFDNHSRKNGGGVYVDSYNLIIENTEISFNSAYDSGGGIYFISPSCDECGVYFVGTTKIFNNSCKNDGGAVKWKDYKPFVDDSVLIYNNSAAYGSDLASIPAKLSLNLMRSLSDLVVSTISNIPPGKKFEDVIKIDILDTYGQRVNTENSITATLFVNETIDSSIIVSGTTNFVAKNGTLYITSFTLTGVPGSNGYLKVKSDNMLNTVVKNDRSEYFDTVYIKIELRNCLKGEQIQASACIDCSAGMYTLKASENCLDCPIGVICPGGGVMIVKNGFWRSSLESDVIYVCEVYDSCLKGTETNELGNCSTGYSGILCKSCESGYSKTANGICTKCPDKEKNTVLIVFLCLAMTFLCFLLVKTTLTSAFSPKSLHSIYIKIFTNYLQLVFAVTQLDLDWPSYVIEFFKIQKASASVTDQLISLDCYISLKNFGDVESTYYTKIFIVTALPIVIVVISYSYWVFYSSLVESYKYLKREVYTTIIVLFFLVYPTIVKFMFSNFSCIKIDKMKSYLNDNTSIECWNLSHKKFSLIVVMPSIILWTIGVPTILLILMTKNRRRLHLDHYRVVYGFLYNGYKQRRFYWEILIMYRKILLITIIVFQISQARAPQALNFILIVLVSIYFQHENKPYNSNELNYMEMQALNISGITIYFGLYYLSKGIGEEIKILLFVLIMLGNSYFIIYWMHYMFGALVLILIKTFPKLRSFLKRGDPFDEEFYNEEIVRKGIYYDHLEGKKAYTFINFQKEIEDKQFKFRNIEEAYIDIAKRDIERISNIREG